MQKIYVRPMSLSYGLNARKLIHSKQAIPISGNKNMAFTHIEIVIRNKKNQIKNININQISSLPNLIKKKVLKQLKNIKEKKKKISGLNLDTFKIFGVLNVTPDSFSDGGKFNKLNLAVNHTT
jgi:dihydropteroate synthase